MGGNSGPGAGGAGLDMLAAMAALSRSMEQALSSVRPSSRGACLPLPPQGGPPSSRGAASFLLREHDAWRPPAPADVQSQQLRRHTAEAALRHQPVRPQRATAGNLPVSSRPMAAPLAGQRRATADISLADLSSLGGRGATTGLSSLHDPPIQQPPGGRVAATTATAGPSSGHEPPSRRPLAAAVPSECGSSSALPVKVVGHKGDKALPFRGMGLGVAGMASRVANMRYEPN